MWLADCIKYPCPARREAQPRARGVLLSHKGSSVTAAREELGHWTGANHSSAPSSLVRVLVEGKKYLNSPIFHCFSLLPHLHMHADYLR